MPRLSDIRAERCRSQRREIHIDGERWRSTSAAVIRAVGLSVGDELPLDELEGALAAEEPAAAFARALRLVAHRERSSAELLQRLVEDGYPDSVARAVVERMTQSGFIDDARFLTLFLSQLTTGRGLGRRRVVYELERKGIDLEAAAPALDEICSYENELVRARARASALVSRGAPTASAVMRRLLSRGFSVDIARTAVDDAFPDGSETR